MAGLSYKKKVWNGISGVPGNSHTPSDEQVVPELDDSDVEGSDDLKEEVQA